MNKIYKIIWSKVKQRYMVVGEYAKSHTKNAGRVVGRVAASRDKKLSRIITASLLVGSLSLCSGVEASSGYVYFYDRVSSGSYVGSFSISTGTSSGTMGFVNSSLVYGSNSITAFGGSYSYQTGSVEASSVLGGSSNSISASAGSGSSSIDASARLYNSSIIGGSSNSISAGAFMTLSNSVIAGGSSNRIMGVVNKSNGGSFIGGGSRNTINGGMYSGIIASTDVVTTGNYDFIAGSDPVAALGNYNTILGSTGTGSAADYSDYTTKITADYGTVIGSADSIVNGARGTVIGSTGVLSGGGLVMNSSGTAAIDSNATTGYGLVKATGGYSTVIGSDATGYDIELDEVITTEATGTHSTIIGSTNAIASGEYSVIIGANNSEASGMHSVAIGGIDVAAFKDFGVAIGSWAQADGVASIAIGYQSNAVNDYDMALGYFSQTEEAGAHTGTTAQKITIQGTTYDFAGLAKANNGTISVGSSIEGIYHQIQNLAAGDVSATSTDAINGSQLYVVAQAVDSLQTGSANAVVYDLNIDGSVNKAKVTFGDADNNVTTKLTNLTEATLSGTSTDAVTGAQLYAANQNIASNTSAIAQNASDISTLQNNLNTLSGNAVAYDDADKTKVTLGGANGTTITNLANGDVSANSKDAVNGSQLYATNQIAEDVAAEIEVIKQYFNADGDALNAVNATNDDNGNNIADTYATKDSMNTLSDAVGTVQDGNYVSSANNVAQNINALDDQVKLNTDNISQNANDIQTLQNSLGTLSNNAVSYDNSNKDVVTLGGNGGTVITNVKAGTLSQTSTDAVNGSQLYATNQNVSANADNIATNASNIANNAAAIENLQGNFNDQGQALSAVNADNATSALSAVSDANGNNIADTYATKDEINTVSDTLGIVQDGNYVASNNTVAENVNALDDQVKANADNISANTTNISNNADAIAQNASAIAQNASDIAQNTSDIAKNKADISLLQTEIQGLSTAGISYDTTSQDIVSFAGTNGTKLTNVSAGEVSATSTDVVTGAQLQDVIDMIDDMGLADVNALKEQLGIVEDGDFVSSNNTIGENINALDAQVKFNADNIASNKQIISDISNKVGTVEDGHFVKSNSTIGENINTLDREVAVNRDAINEIGNSVNRGFSEMNRRVNKSGANAAALAALHPNPIDSDSKFDVAVGLGAYHGSRAGAVGMFYRPNERVMLSMGGSMAGQDDVMVNVGAVFSLDRNVGQGLPSKKVMAQHIIQLEKTNSTVVSELKDTKAELKETRAELDELKKMYVELANKVSR